MRLPRMTTRRWMTAVAAVCLFLAVGLCLGLADRNARAARFWDVRRQRYLEDGTPIFNGAWFDSAGTVKEPYGSQFERTSKRYAALGRKYECAAAHPWLSVDAGPPEPRWQLARITPPPSMRQARKRPRAGSHASSLTRKLSIRLMPFLLHPFSPRFFSPDC